MVITGGGTGIGAETAHYFAKAGASRIALLGRREQPLLDTKASIEKDFDVAVFAASTDVTNEADVEAAFKAFVGTQKVHVLVVCAATVGPKEAIKDVDSQKFLESIESNLKGSLFVAQTFLRYALPDAVIINISSAAARINVSPQGVAYSVSKLAAFRFWDSFAFANPSMSVFHVHPGLIETDMMRDTADLDLAKLASNSKFIRWIEASNAKIFIVSLPASFNVWLASSEARFLKGKFLWANWDVNELRIQAQEIEASPQLTIGLVGWPFQALGAKIVGRSIQGRQGSMRPVCHQ